MVKSLKKIDKQHFAHRREKQKPSLGKASSKRAHLSYSFINKRKIQFSLDEQLKIALSNKITPETLLINSKGDIIKYKELLTNLSEINLISRYAASAMLQNDWNIYPGTVISNENDHSEDSLSNYSFSKWLKVNKKSIKGLTPYHISRNQDIIVSVNDILEKNDSNNSIIFVFDTAEIAIKNDSLADIIIQKKILISSIKESKLTNEYCKRLHYISEKYPIPESKNFDDFALDVGQLLYQFHCEGKQSFNEKAKALMNRQVRTHKGKNQWDIATVRYVFLRWQELTGNKVNLKNSHKTKSKVFALNMKDIFDELDQEGFKSNQAKADELNKRGIETFRGNLNWKPGSVHNVKQKIKNLSNADTPQSGIN